MFLHSPAMMLQVDPINKEVFPFNLGFCSFRVYESRVAFIFTPEQRNDH